MMFRRASKNNGGLATTGGTAVTTKERRQSSSEPEEQPYLIAEEVKKYFPVGHHRFVRAVDGASFTIARGETLALVGESGCGKSTLGRTLLGLYKPTSGRIIYGGMDMSHFNSKDRAKFAFKAQMIFQDPYSSLNPRMTVGDIVAEGLDIHRLCKTPREREERVDELLHLVGLNSEQANRYPREFSGGQRQRIGIARALALNPEFIVCDEAISALDVSIQAQIVNLLRHLQEQMGLTYLFIAHNLNMVRYISHRVAVMYLGTIVELGDSDDVFHHPVHPYTKMLIDALPIADPDVPRVHKVVNPGEIPGPLDVPSGCPFYSRCPMRTERCAHERPELAEVGGGRSVACFGVEHGEKG